MIVKWLDSEVVSDVAWEAAYVKFETPEQEMAKFRNRLDFLGVETWPRDARVVELFCGRGNGLRVLESLGFTALEGVDLSRTLLERYRGLATLYQGDCRHLHFEDSSKDVVVVHGGLHHLPVLPDDLVSVLREVCRILRPNGRFVFVEPWLTPFLRLVHFACSIRFLRAIWPRLDALSGMIAGEYRHYEQWLNHPDLIMKSIENCFDVEFSMISRGKINYVVRKKYN